MMDRLRLSSHVMPVSWMPDQGTCIGSERCHTSSESHDNGLGTKLYFHTASDWMFIELQGIFSFMTSASSLDYVVGKKTKNTKN